MSVVTASGVGIAETKKDGNNSNESKDNSNGIEIVFS